MMKISKYSIQSYCFGYFFNANANDWKHLDSQGYLNNRSILSALKFTNCNGLTPIWPEHNKSPKPFSNRFDIKTIKQNIRDIVSEYQLLLTLLNK